MTSPGIFDRSEPQLSKPSPDSSAGARGSRARSRTSAPRSVERVWSRPSHPRSPSSPAPARPHSRPHRAPEPPPHRLELHWSLNTHALARIPCGIRPVFALRIHAHTLTHPTLSNTAMKFTTLALLSALSVSSAAVLSARDTTCAASEQQCLAASDKAAFCCPQTLVRATFGINPPRLF